ncbi:MAG: MFS transporter [Dehalococcoidales bacterium]|jgi:NNP family nitrate/nitrite transporter-like MFS transporter|nr:MFS transporter [Dehalococcoidales bacterium]MDP6633170.1 MFS transporter [Dehalococcoidales bacterium]
MLEKPRSTYRRWLLALSATSGTFVMAVPFSSMPVLFKEISDDLGLSLVQIGTVWGMASLAGVFVSLIAGVLGDRFGTKRTVSTACLLIGITGAMRGLADSFLSLVLIMFVFGVVRAILPINLTRNLGLWFKGKNLGLANGVMGMGIGTGLMLGPLISASVLSPLLGGWRDVLFLYGIIPVILSVLWALYGREPNRVDTLDEHSEESSIRQKLATVVRIKALWLIGFTLVFRMGGIIGMTGYLPLYLRGKGWVPARADGTLAAFYAVSTLFVIPLSSLSDKIGSRKAILIPATLVTLICLSLLPIADGIAVWVLLVVAGIFMDGFMAVMVTLLMETRNVKPAYSGVALGLVFTIAQLGGVLSPPLGNSFAGINPGLPFIFWAGLSVVAAILLLLIKETGWRASGTRKVRPVNGI